MPAPRAPTRHPRTLQRTFQPARLAAPILAQVYEWLLPGARRPLGPPATPAEPRRPTRQTPFRNFI